MRINPAVVVAVSAGIAAALAPSPAAAAKKRPLPDCAAKKSKTLAASKKGRVYSIGTNVYACGYRKNKRVLLGDSKECQNQTEVSEFKFGNGVLGYIAASCGLVSGDSTVVVKGLNTGRTKWVGSPVDERPQGGESSSGIESWDMKPNGSIVWIGRNSGFVTTPGGPPAPPADTIQVWKNEQGTPTKLDSGADIVVGSLALGSISNPTSGEAPFYWRKGSSIFGGTVK